MTKVLYVIALSGLCLRAEPSTKAPAVNILPYATKVMGTVEDGWLQTEEGYLCGEYLAETDPLDDAQYLGTWKLTAYAETGLATACGEYPEAHVTAAHNTLPFGSRIYVRDHGVWTIQDRGPESMGSEWADLYLADHQTCVDFGMRTADVYLLPEEEMP